MSVAVEDARRGVRGTPGVARPLSRTCPRGPSVVGLTRGIAEPAGTSDDVYSTSMMRRETADLVSGPTRRASSGADREMPRSTKVRANAGRHREVVCARERAVDRARRVAAGGTANEARHQASLLVEWGEASNAGRVLLDAGHGLDIVRLLLAAGYDPVALSDIFVSHQHLDHVGGLEPLLRRMIIATLRAHGGPPNVPTRVFAEQRILGQIEQLSGVSRRKMFRSFRARPQVAARFGDMREDRLSRHPVDAGRLARRSYRIDSA
jgi:metallo-beta-lactamase superfamily protein